MQLAPPAFSQSWAARQRRIMILTQIEAKEACDWLQAAGFPQYVQLYEDLIFPIDITSVKREHDFLDRDAIEALCRRENNLKDEFLPPSE